MGDGAPSGEIYGDNPKTQAVIVVGSLARGQTDEFSDLDMSVLYETMPTNDEIAAGRAALVAAEWRRFPGAEADALADSFRMNDIECQVVHCLVSRLEKDLSAVLEEHATEHEKHVIAGGILDAQPLSGHGLLDDWKRRLSVYPEELTQAMVQVHLDFRPLWIVEQRLARRDAPLLVQQFLQDDVMKILGALSGLNKIFPELHYKRLDSYIARMPHTPLDLSARLRRILTAEPAEATATLGSVVKNLLAMVAKHLPEVDTAARAKFGQAARTIS